MTNSGANTPAEFHNSMRDPTSQGQTGQRGQTVHLLYSHLTFCTQKRCGFPSVNLWAIYPIVIPHLWRSPSTLILSEWLLARLLNQPSFQLDAPKICGAEQKIKQMYGLTP